jgi:hypothetical protein
MTILRSLHDFARFQATGANFDPFPGAIDQGTNGLQIRIKAAARFIICVGNIIAELRAFAAEFTTISHNYLRNSLVFLGCTRFCNC